MLKIGNRDKYVNLPKYKKYLLVVNTCSNMYANIFHTTHQLGLLRVRLSEHPMGQHSSDTCISAVKF